MKKVIFYLNSIKQSVLHKPSALVLLIVVFVTITIVSSILSRVVVAEVKRTYDLPNTLNGDVRIESFEQNYQDIAKTIRKNAMNIAFDKDLQVVSAFIFASKNRQILVNGEEKNLEMCRVQMEVLSSEFFTEQELANGTDKIFVGDDLRKRTNIQKNDIINLFGKEFVVQGFCENDVFLLPWNIKFDELKGASIATCYILNVKHFGLKELTKQLTNFGVKILGKEVNFSLILDFVFYICVLAICTMSSISVLNYWQNINNKKYATYKILGAKPFGLAVAMVIETMVIAFLAIGIGLIFDAIFGVFIANNEVLTIKGYEWLHYLLILGGLFVAILVLTIIKVSKRAKAVPIDNRFMV